MMMKIIHIVILVMMQIFRTRKIKIILLLFELQHGNPYVINYFTREGIFKIAYKIQN